MRTFQDFLKDRLRQRLVRHRVLIVYDPERRYRDVVLSLADSKTQVIEVTDDVIAPREDALEAWRNLANDPTNASTLVICLPKPRQLDEVGQREDPFTPFALAGAVFPDGAGDNYMSLCQQFLPEQAGAIEELFREGAPAFPVINGLVAGTENSPVLTDVLKAEGTRDILVKYLCLGPTDSNKLRKTPHWLKELKALVSKTLGLTLHGDEVDMDEIRLQIWRYLLFSEFAADLPSGLPVGLSEVPRAPARCEPFVLEMCMLLRDVGSAQTYYEKFANRVANDLNLERHCRGLEDLGRLDTFAFQERSFLKRFEQALMANALKDASQLLVERSTSFWLREAQRAAEWKLAACCYDLVGRLSQLEVAIREQPTRSVTQWIDFYVSEFWRADSLHRELEQVAQEIGAESSTLDEVVAKARNEYHDLADKLSRLFQAAVTREGWPASGRARATEVFDRFVRQPWQQGKRVAYFWVDAFRYELAHLLGTALGARHGVTVQPVCAQLPTVTKVGMAALVPGAEGGLELKVEAGGIVAMIKGQVIDSPTARFQLVQNYVGQDRTRFFDLEELAGAKFQHDLSARSGIEVVVVKTSDIDQLGENNPAYFIQLIPGVLRKLRLVINRLADFGFNVAVLTGDHGFCWFHETGAGSAVKRPVGDWIQVKNRSLLGSGQGGDDVTVLDAADAGIRGDIKLYVAANGLATFTKGVRYFHDGLSPQECVLPLMQVELKSAAGVPAMQFDIVLTYRGETSGSVTTLRPTVEVSYPGSDLFGPNEVRFLLEGYDGRGKKVAEAAASPNIDPGTKEVTIDRSKSIKVPIRIDEGFEGEFQLRAMNRDTSETYAKLKLATDFHH